MAQPLAVFQEDMSTRTFKSIRIFVHLLTLLLLLANLCLLVTRCVFHNYMVVDMRANDSLFNLSFFYIFTGMINIMFSFFGACCINSKIKLYMRIFLCCDFVAICFMLAALLFTQTWYSSIFRECYFEKTTNFARFVGFVEDMLNCRDSGARRCEIIVDEQKRKCLSIYKALTSLSAVLSSIIFLLVKAGTNSKIRKDPVVVPPIKECTKVGLSSASLRVRRVMDPSLPPST